MPKHKGKNYKTDSELRLLMIQTISMGLSINESVQYLSTKGYDITDRTVRSLRANIRSRRQDRLNQIAIYEFTDSHLDSIDNLNHIKQEMWLNYHKEQNIYRKVEILTQIANLEPYITEYYSLVKKIIQEYKEDIVTKTSRQEIESKQYPSSI